MSVDVYYDANGAAQDPAAAISILTESVQGHLVRHEFTDMWRGHQLPRAATLAVTDAILMQGTTAELREDLGRAVSAGLRAIDIPNDYLEIWYFRRRAGAATKTVVSIAPRQRYWGGQNTPYNLGWRNLHPSQVYSGGISLETLADHILPTVQGQKAWY